MNEKPPIKILYSGNVGVYDGIITSTLSIVMNLQSPREIEINIFTMELTEINEKYVPISQQQTKELEKLLQKHNQQTTVNLYDVSEEYSQELKGCKNENCYCSPYTLLRLLADKVLAMKGKLLYLDADVMLVGDIAKLYDKDVNGYEYLASRDYYGKFFLGVNYINAGVLLFNLDECERTKIFVKARKKLIEKKLPFADQSALIRATTKKKVISQRFNDQKFLHKNTLIRHFSKRLFYLPYPHAKNIKQWHIAEMKKKFGYDKFDNALNEYINFKEYQNRRIEKIDKPSE